MKENKNKLCLVSGFHNTKKVGEDFAITPYLFSVIVNGDIIKVFGIGICWGYYSFYIGIGYNIPEKYRGFKNLYELNNPTLPATPDTSLSTHQAHSH
jgi:hypothetical protein